MIQLPSVFLSFVVWSAFVGFLVVLFMPERSDEDRSRIRLVGLGASGFTLVLVLIFGMYSQISLGAGGGQTSAGEENHTWLAFSFLARYHLTADGVSLVLILLSTLVFTSVFFHSWRQRLHLKLYIAMLLLLETAVNGVLCSADYVLFVLFWGMQILPMYVLLRVFAGSDRLRAATLYLGASLLALVLVVTAAVLVIVKAGQQTSDIATDYTTLLPAVETAGFWLSFAGFALAMAVFPVHRWMVVSHSDASPGVGAIASGVLLPLGAYGILRITLPTFPNAAHHFSIALTAIAVAGALWGSIAALAQSDVRRRLTYVSVAQMSIVMLALSAGSSVALVGAVLMLVASGLGIAMLTLMSGAVEERTRTRSLARLGGLAAQAPRLAAFWLFAALSIIGVPLLAGFVGQFLVFTGSFPEHRVATVVVVASLLITAAALLSAGHRIFLGPAQEVFTRARDVGALELAVLIPLAAFVLLFGIRPGGVTPMVTNGILTITTRLLGV